MFIRNDKIPNKTSITLANIFISGNQLNDRFC